jgi:signal transduction histidine kinase
MTVIQDITGRKQAEQQRFELAVERERIEVLQQFISDASHDLRTPLTAIKSGLYLLKKTSDPEKQHERLAALDTQTAHLEKPG